MGFIKTGLALDGGYSLMKAASKAAAEHEEQKQKQRENLQPASQRLRHAAQQQYFLNNKRRMGYKDGSQMNNPHVQPSYPPHEPRSNHDSNVNKPKPKAQSQSSHQPSIRCTSTRTMDDPPPYDPLPQAHSQSTHQPSICSSAIENPPPYDQSHPYKMQDFWNDTALILNSPTNCRSGIDINSVLASINTFDPAAKLADGSRSIYGINKGKTAGKAAAVGRYTEDIFMGGNSWYLATLATAEQLYDTLYQWDRQGAFTVTTISLPFFRDFVANIHTGVYPKSSPACKSITDAVRAYADGFIAVVQGHAPANGGLWEEFKRNKSILGI
ncbi:Glucoamylase [Penicillium chrysogenum]|uniref:1,4-alpha-D-glucan glucohydrolase n=2 Tax=Penicillium chrysogenum species complex TaxID=254878 RepID=A0A167R6B9_PENCH|nr:Glucoamylase [Penicillium chrysogenum]